MYEVMVCSRLGETREQEDALAQKHQRLPATFSMERKHKTITRYAGSIMNTTAFERSLYEEVVALALERPRQPPAKLRELLKQWFPGVPEEEFQVATNFRLAGGGWDCAEVWFHASVQGRLWSLVALWSLQVYSHETHSALWTPLDEPVLIHSSEILIAVMHCKDSVGLRTLIPHHHRC